MFKKGEVHDPVNYRPIALLPVLSKVFECLINDQLRSFHELNQIIDTAQHGFWKERSWETALLGLTIQLFKLRNAKTLTCIMALDFSCAFDTLHQHSYQAISFTDGLLSNKRFWLRFTHSYYNICYLLLIEVARYHQYHQYVTYLHNFRENKKYTFFLECKNQDCVKYFVSEIKRQ